MRVLSIDFDYFQDVSQDQLYYYPDGVDNNTLLSELVWGSHYACYGDEIKKIGIRQAEFDMLKKLLKNQSPVDGGAMIANSHVQIYDFIHEFKKKGNPLRIVNIDLHHDVVNDNPYLDCGNWLSYIIQEQEGEGSPISFNWIVNPISLETYGIEGLFEDAFNGKTPVLNSISDIADEKFDLIFLCRSDTWTPPHLDKYFTEVCVLMRSLFPNLRQEKGIDMPRTEYKRYAEKEIQMRQELSQNIKNPAT